MAQLTDTYISSIANLLIINNDGSYSQKTGDDFVQAFNEYVKSKFSEKKSNNLKLFTKDQVENSPKLSDFNFSGLSDFKYFGKIKCQPLKIYPDKTYDNQKLSIELDNKAYKDTYENHKGILYLIVGVVNNEEHIVKFGQTRKTLKDRIGSYNCGTIKSLGTASTTNIFILQSLISSKIDYNIYIVDCSDFIEQFRWYDSISNPFASSKSLAFEHIVLKKYIEQYKDKPLANTQIKITNNEIIIPNDDE